MTLISAVIPTCNRSSFLAKAIDSVRSQSFLPYELIIVNNGSEPLDIEPITLFPIKVYNIINYAGPSQARNFGASLAKGEYVSFLDDDDYWDINYLKEIEESISKNNKPNALLGRLDRLINGSVLPGKNPHNSLSLRVLYRRNPGASGQNTTVKKDSFVQLGGYDPQLPTAEDKSLIIDFLLNDKNVVTVPEAQCIVRRHNDGHVSSSSNLAKGTERFLEKYKIQMSYGDRIFNRFKIHRYKYQATGKVFNLLTMGYYKLIYGLYDKLVGGTKHS